MRDQMAFTVHDQKLEAYITPFFAPTAADAIRSFTEAANTVDHNFHKHAEDYSLWMNGSFDQSTGDITGSPPVMLCKAFDVVRGEM